MVMVGDVLVFVFVFVFLFVFVFVFIFIFYLCLKVCNQVEDDLPMVVEEDVLGGGEEIEQEKKFTRPRFVQVRFVGFSGIFL